MPIVVQCEFSSGAGRFDYKMLNLNNDFLQIKQEDYAAAIAKYDLTDTMARQSMDTIRQWYGKQQHLPEEGLTDDRLFRHLLVVGFRLEKAKLKIDSILTSRTLVPEIMSQRDPIGEWTTNLRRQVHWITVPQRLEDMTRITIWSYTGEYLPHVDVWEVYKYGIMMTDYRMCNDISLGEHLIVDLKDLPLSHVTGTTPTKIKKALFIIQKCFCVKVKGIYILNLPQFAEVLLSIFKAGLSKKITERLKICKDYESLQKDLPKKLLPADMGGLNKTIQELADDTYAALCEPASREWFLAQDSLITDESRRIGLDNDVSSVLLGMHGSFRQLDVD